MANVYVGFHDNRSCNRILKPPGGGTSDIFGTDRMPDVVPRSPPKFEKASSVQETLQTETTTKEESAPDVVAEKIENLQIEEDTKSETDSVVTTVTKTEVEVRSSTKSSTIADVLNQDGVAVKDADFEKKPKPKTPNRVPPGGYSSGLW